MGKIQLILSALAIGYVSLGLFLYIFQRDYLYFPSYKYDHPHQVKTFHPDNESIEVIVLNEYHEKAIIYFGGNGEAVVNGASDHINNFPTHTIYLVNYRGYGGSSGKPEEQTIYADALHIYDELSALHSDIAVIGRSLGSSVATYIGSKREIEKMVLVTPFDSIERIAQSQYPLFPVSLLLKDKFDSISRVSAIGAKTLVILAEQDEVIPLENSLRLIQAFPVSQITVATIRGAGHNNLSGNEGYHSLMQDFMR